MQLNEFISVLDVLVDDARGKKVIVAGDFNAWAMEWGCQNTNARGRTLLESFATLEVGLLKSANEFTFSQAGYGSIIVLTFFSSTIFRET